MKRRSNTTCEEILLHGHEDRHSANEQERQWHLHRRRDADAFYVLVQQLVYPTKITQVSVKDTTDAVFYVQAPFKVDLPGEMTYQYNWVSMLNHVQSTMGPQDLPESSRKWMKAIDKSMPDVLKRAQELGFTFQFDNRCTPSGLNCGEGSVLDFTDGGLADIGGTWGMPLGSGRLTIASEFRGHNRTNRASADPRDQVVAGDAGNNAVAEPNHRWGDPDTRDVMTFANAALPLNASATRSFYGFGGYSRRTANSAGFYRRALDVRNQPAIYPLGFLPEIQPAVVDVSGRGRRPRRVQPVELRLQRGCRSQQLFVHHRQYAQHLPWPDGRRTKPRSTPAR